MSGRSTLGILLGGTAGVGPETVVKLAASRFYDECRRPVVIGDVEIFERGARICGLEIPVRVVNKVGETGWTKNMPALDRRDVDPEQVPLISISIEGRRACLGILKAAVELYQAGGINGFCFAPLNKQATIRAGRSFESGHHYMARPFNHADPFGEINVLEDLWTTKVTSHIPISKVSESLTVDTIMRAIGPVSVPLKNSDTEKLRLALAALNPHCGKGRKCGRERIDVIASATEKAKEMEIDADGPPPSGILSIKAFNRDSNGVATMYHGQGQITFKSKGFGQGIAIAGDLPAPIVICAHDTAYDITGEEIVKTSAFKNAVRMAAKMVTHLKGC